MRPAIEHPAVSTHFKSSGGHGRRPVQDTAGAGFHPISIATDSGHHQ
jgi:hypothetical protein